MRGRLHITGWQLIHLLRNKIIVIFFPSDGAQEDHGPSDGKKTTSVREETISSCCDVDHVHTIRDLP